MISIISAIYNERPFILAWCRNAKRISNDIHVLDMGSTDGTREVLALEGIRYHTLTDFEMLTEFEPYVNWHEGDVMNWLMDRCKHDWVMRLDADELVFPGNVLALQSTSAHFIRLRQLAFYYSPNTYRIAQLRGNQQPWRRFYPFGSQWRMFRNDPKVRFICRDNHAYLSYRGLGKWSPRLSARYSSEVFFHYHFCQPPKINDNRLSDWQRSGIHLSTYFGGHPEETKLYSWWDK